MTTKLRRSLAAAGAAALLGVLATVGALGAVHSTSADPSGPGGPSVGSPGVLSGNVVVHPPINTCTDTNPDVGALNPAVGQGCTSD